MSSQTPVQDARRVFAQATSGPTPLGAWREVGRTGRLADDPDPDRTAAGLTRRWHHHLALVLDEPVERHAPGATRLAGVAQAYLDLARRTPGVRAHLVRVDGPASRAERARQRAAVVDLLAADLMALGHAEPVDAAGDLLESLDAVARQEDLAGRPLRALRRGVLPGSPASHRPSRRLRCVAGLVHG